MRIVFFGTPDFAAEQLEYLIKQGVEIVAIVTAPDKPAGRGKKLSQSSVKAVALKYMIPVFQPTNLKDPSFINDLKSVCADLFVVIAFRMLPEVIWKLPPLGTFNLHASLLPQYRGAAPINRAIINGESRTGLTTFFINETIDTGHILKQVEIEIGANETAGELHDRMIEEGKILIINTLQDIEHGRSTALAQASVITDSTLLKAAPKLYKEDGKINWGKEGNEIHNQIRGLSPHPGAFTQLIDNEGNTLDIKIYRSEFESKFHDEAQFTLMTDNRTYLKVALRDGYLHLNQLQQAGKKTLFQKEFLNGFKFSGKWSVNLAY